LVIDQTIHVLQIVATYLVFVPILAWQIKCSLV
jgi:hypothetical protein